MKNLQNEVNNLFDDLSKKGLTVSEQTILLASAHYQLTRSLTYRELKEADKLRDDIIKREKLTPLK